MRTIHSAQYVKNKLIESNLKSALGIVLLSSSMIGVAYALPAPDPSHWPTAVVDSASADTEQAISIPVIANDIGIGLEITKVNTTTKRLGSAVINADKKSVSYRSAIGFEGVDTFWYDFKDSQGRTNAAKVTVTVSDKQVKPSAWPTPGYESPEVESNTPTEMAVLDNDNGVGLTITSVNTTTVKLGSVSISGDGKKLIYTPPKDFSGNDEFWYVFSDSWGRTNAGKVTPVVADKKTGSPWPTATPDYTSTVSTRSVVIPVLENDIGDNLTLTKVNTTTVGLGSASIINSSIRYVPPINFSGQDSFWYDFQDQDGRKNSTQIFVDVTKNTQLSSIEFCGANYFTDGTLANTTTSDKAVDPAGVELETSVETEEFVSPTNAFAVIGNRTYVLQSDDALGKRLILEEEDQRAVLTEWSQDDIYGVGVRDDTLYFAMVPTNQPALPEGVSTNAIRTNLISHKAGSELKTLGSYILESGKKIQMIANLQSTLIRYNGYQNIGEGPDVVIIPSGPAQNINFQYHEVDTQSGEAIFLGSNLYESRFGSSYSQAAIEKVFSYDQHLIRSVKRSSQQGAFPGPTNYYLESTTADGGLIPNPPSARLDKAVISNNRLLLTTIPHQNTRFTNGNPGGTTDFPAKLYSFDSITGEFVELATCD